jgi:integrase
MATGAGQAGLADGINPLRNHDLRHDFATKLLRSNRDLKLVQRAMGHANVTTTMRYAHVIDEDVHKAVAVQAKNRIRKKSLGGSNPLAPTKKIPVRSGHMGYGLYRRHR